MQTGAIKVNTEVIMTEDAVVIALCVWLESKGWEITKKCLGRDRGNDIEATKKGRKLIVEAKGARGNLSHTTRARFDKGQNKINFGAAVVKVLEQRSLDKNVEIAIAFPDDEKLREDLSMVSPMIKSLNITVYWVKSGREVKVE